MSINVSNRLSAIAVTGTPFEIGKALGQHGAAAAHRHLIRTHAWAVVTGFRDSERVQTALALTEKHFPNYLDELTGLADGLDLPFESVFAWNCRGDVWALSPDGCTTVQTPGSQQGVAHNEDGDPGLRTGCAIATVQPDQGRAFSAFVYPASIPGHTFALNDAGLVMTVNNIRSRQSGNGLPRMVLTRALLDCTSLDEAINLLRASPRSGAFHLTLARPGEPEILSVEFTHGDVSVIPVAKQSCHANHLIHDTMIAEKQVVTGSSLSRQERGDEMLALCGTISADPLTILRDTQRTALPIYRMQPDDPDNENTLATANFVIGADSVECAVYDNLESSSRFRFRSDALSPQ
ncbi:C45 family autoproteolytic acyltransferase/hydrolase [Ochrobactrum teleogrylli]|uniref:Peptidase C45 n=1 Tax=Ochrobactrum teleogrylli TaxID=2479765 RepID=A0ABY2Y2F7_9HYPH|nr:C45 family peptidase [[Ochrobactrum] teleogrylli]TNV11588.1 peptidase C45 [[Ochrobactrum] teleogrylli]